MYLAGIGGISHLLTVMSSGRSAPAALGSGAIPTLGDWVLKPAPKPAIFVAGLILPEIWPTDRPEDTGARANNRLLGPDRQQGLHGREGQVEGDALGLLIADRDTLT